MVRPNTRSKRSRQQKVENSSDDDTGGSSESLLGLDVFATVASSVNPIGSVAPSRKPSSPSSSSEDSGSLSPFLDINI